MLCEECGEAPATSRVTEMVRGTLQESSLCGKCASTLAGLESEDAFRCSKCGAKIEDATLIHMVQSLKAKRGRFDEDVWNELLATAACPICGESLKLPRIPWGTFADPSSAIPLAILARRRPPPLSSDSPPS